MAFKWPWAENKQKNPSTGLAGGRVSVPDIKSSFLAVSKMVEFVQPGFQYEYIPVIRKLLSVNSSVSLATITLTELANTGFTLTFDESVTPEQERLMLAHLDLTYKKWGQGVPGIHGVINKMIQQMYIGGAISTEWVPEKNLSGIAYPAFLNPEKIRTSWNPVTERFDFYQVPSTLLNKKFVPGNHIKMNPMTYAYMALISDEEAPIGIPPFLSALDDINSQQKMLKNIGFVSDQLGLMGFLEVLLQKPDIQDGETPDKYRARMSTYLNDAKASVSGGVKDGVVAGFMNDHEFNFHSPTKDTAGVAEIFDINQRMTSNGLFISSQFMGGQSSGAETMVNVIFTKMLSQLNNIQVAVATVLEQGITVDLRLSGFNFKSVKAGFKPSTITDLLKTYQSEEINVRNSRILYADGIIGQEGYAKRVGLSKPDMKEPRVEIDPTKIAAEVASSKKKEADSDKSDRKSRDKKKSQPKRNDQSTKSR